jgi:glutamate carboxypeptidase
LKAKSSKKSRLAAIAMAIGTILLLCLWWGQGHPAGAALNRSIYNQAQISQSNFLTNIKALVNIDSGTGDAAGLQAVEKLVIEQLRSLGAEVKTVALQPVADQPGAGRNILATLRGRGKSKILLLAHTDTVFKAGDVAKHPFQISGNKASGLGIMDDKGGILLGIEALKILQQNNFQDFGTIGFLINPDEETGSKGSRELIKATAKNYDVALVLEFGSPQDKVTAWRKGIGYYKLEVKGQAAHAGADADRACNALLEAAYQTLQLRQLSDPQKNTTVNFTLLQSGDRPNIIPDRATAQADIRVLDAREYDRLERDSRRLISNKLLPCSEVKVAIERGRPPFPSNPRTDRLVKTSQSIYRELGLLLGVEGSGGGTDGNYTFSVGTATLDALGPVGSNAHKKDEYIEIDRLAPRIYLLTRLLMELSN